MSFLRQRKNFAKLIKELDAFPKVEEDHQESTASGGGLSLVVFCLITILVVFEIDYYLDQGVKYEYDIDPHFDKKLKLNLDIMVAMKCSLIGADILDIMGENVDKFGNLEEQDMEFDMTESQRTSFQTMKSFNDYARNEYHSIHQHLWKAQRNLGPEFSLRKIFPIQASNFQGQDANGCRFHGTLEVNKVAGNFHITAGKALNIAGSHLHLSFDDEEDYNFSHRILHFSFGDHVGSLINPLDAEEKIAHEANHIYQYFIQVVPTSIQSYFGTVETYQYAVTEQNRTISHAKGSHGLPGIYIKYDLSPLRVKVMDRSTSVIQLLIRLCGIIGGIFSTSGIIHMLITGLVDVIFCKRCKTTNHHYNRQQRQATPSDTSVELVSLINSGNPHFQDVPLPNANGYLGGGSGDSDVDADDKKLLIGVGGESDDVAKGSMLEKL